MPTCATVNGLMPPTLKIIYTLKKVMEKYSKQNKIEGNEFTLKYSFIYARWETVNDLCEKVLFYTPKITLSEPEKGDNYNAGNKLQWHPGTTIEITKAKI